MHMCDIMDQSTLCVHNIIYWVDSAYISWHGGNTTILYFSQKWNIFSQMGDFFSFLIICMVHKPNHQLLCPYSHIHCIIAKRNQIQNGTSIMQNGKQTCPTMQYNSSHNAIFKMKSMEDRCYLSLIPLAYDLLSLGFTANDVKEGCIFSMDWMCVYMPETCNNWLASILYLVLKYHTTGIIQF